MNDQTTNLQDKMAALKGANSASAIASKQVPDPVEKQDQDSAPGVPEVPKIQVIPEKTYHVFYNTIQSVKMITTGGRTMAFVLGKYVTDVQEEIDYLNTEIAVGNIHLSVKEGEEVMTASDLDPMASLRKQHFKEFAEAQAEVARKIAAGEPLSQSESEVQQLTPGSTSDIAALAAGSGK